MAWAASHCKMYSLRSLHTYTQGMQWLDTLVGLDTLLYSYVPFHYIYRPLSLVLLYTYEATRGGIPHLVVSWSSIALPLAICSPLPMVSYYLPDLTPGLVVLLQLCLWPSAPQHWVTVSLTSLLALPLCAKCRYVYCYFLDHDISLAICNGCVPMGALQGHLAHSCWAEPTSLVLSRSSCVCITLPFWRQATAVELWRQFLFFLASGCLCFELPLGCVGWDQWMTKSKR